MSFAGDVALTDKEIVIKEDDKYHFKFSRDESATSREKD